MEPPPLNGFSVLWIFGNSLLVLVIVVWLIQRYVSFSETRKYIYFPVLVGYYLSIGILFLLPVDIDTTLYLNCMNRTVGNESMCYKPVNYVEADTLETLWTIIYWTTFFSTWAVYPLLQSYSYSGHFSFKRKLLGAIRENIIFYGVGGIVYLAILIYVFVTVNYSFEATYGIGIAMSNAWGLLLLVLFLGYGLVHIPRSLWRLADRKIYLKYLFFKIEGYEKQKIQSKNELEVILGKIKLMDEAIDEGEPERKHIDTIINQCPEDYIHADTHHRRKDVTYDYLVTLHQRLKATHHNIVTSECLFDQTLKKAYDLEDTIIAREKGWTAKINYTHRESTQCCGGFFNSLNWLFSLISPVFYRILAIICAFLSVTIVWSESIFFILPQFSVYERLVFWFDGTNMVQVITLIGISYLAICVYSGLFNLRLMSFYRLVPGQNTDANSLLFSAAYLSRLNAPLVLNFFYLINMVDSNLKIEPSFLEVVGSMSVFPLLGQSFQIYFPIIVLIVTVLTLFGCGNRMLSICKVKRFQFSEDWNDERINRGREIFMKSKNPDGSSYSDDETNRLIGDDVRDYEKPSILDRIFLYFMGDSGKDFREIPDFANDDEISIEVERPRRRSPKKVIHTPPPSPKTKRDSSSSEGFLHDDNYEFQIV